MCLDCAPQLSLQISYSSPQDTKPHTFWLCASQTTPLWMYPARKIPTSWRIFVPDLILQLSTVAGWKQNSKAIPCQYLVVQSLHTQACHFQPWWSVFCLYYQCSNQFNDHNTRSASDMFQILLLKSPISILHSCYKPSFTWTYILCTTTIGLRY